MVGIGVISETAVITRSGSSVIGKSEIWSRIVLMILYPIHSISVHVDVSVSRDDIYIGCIMLSSVILVVHNWTVTAIKIILEDHEDSWPQNSFQSVESVVIPSVRIVSVVVVPRRETWIHLVQHDNLLYLPW